MKTRCIVSMFLAMLLFPALIRAQNTTTVSATIVDTNGVPYSYASVSAQLISSGTPTIPPPCNGQSVSPCAVSSFSQATADSTGTFSMNLASNAVLSPGGSQWQFTVNMSPGVGLPFGTGPQKFSVPLTISGATQNISTNLSAAAPALTRTYTGTGTVTTTGSPAANDLTGFSGPKSIGPIGNTTTWKFGQDSGDDLDCYDSLGCGFELSTGPAGSGNNLFLFPNSIAIADGTTVFQFQVIGGLLTLGSTHANTDVNGNFKVASLLAAGLADGTAPVIVTTGTSGTPGATYNHSYSFNQEATAGAGVIYTLPPAAAGKQYCIANSYNGSAPNTGALTIQTSAAGQYVIFTDGTLSATGGYVISGGAAADAACVVGVDATHWFLYVQSGTWTKH